MKPLNAESRCEACPHSYLKILRAVTTASGCKAVRVEDLSKGSLGYDKQALTFGARDALGDFFEFKLLDPSAFFLDLEGSLTNQDFPQKEVEAQIKLLEELGNTALQLAAKLK